MTTHRVGRERPRNRMIWEESSTNRRPVGTGTPPTAPRTERVDLPTKRATSRPLPTRRPTKPAPRCRRVGAPATRSPRGRPRSTPMERHRWPRHRNEPVPTPRVACSAPRNPRRRSRHASRTTRSRTTATATSCRPIDDPLSTFALDVDTGSYSVARRWLDEGTLPPSRIRATRGVHQRVPIRLRRPTHADSSCTIDGGPSPFDDDNYLVRVGVQGRDRRRQRPGPGRAHLRDRHVGFDGSRRPARSREVRRSRPSSTSSTTTTRSRSSPTTTTPAWSSSPPPSRDRDVILDAIDRLAAGRIDQSRGRSPRRATRSRRGVPT